MHISVELEVDGEDWAAFIDAGKDAREVLASAIHFEGEFAREQARYAAAEAAGELFVAKWMRYHSPYEEKYLDPGEAVHHLQYGDDAGEMASTGVFTESGKLVWDNRDGWRPGYKPEGWRSFYESENED